MPARVRQPLLAGVCCAMYALVHTWWAVAGAPAFVSTGESYFPGGWVPVVPSGIAAAASLLVAFHESAGHRPVRLLLVGSAAVGGAGMIAYCMLVWIDLAMVLMVPFGLPMPSVGLLLVRVGGVAGGCLALAGAVAELRSTGMWIAADRAAPTPVWGWAGAILAVGGLAARLVPALPRWFHTGISGPGGAGFVLFVVLLLLAGTALPLALVFRWGRLWPTWAGRWAGHPVPRWLVLGPGLFMGSGLTAYFGVGAISAMMAGQVPVDVPAVLAIGGYTAWGLGLLIASASYARMTARPGAPAILKLSPER